MSTGIPTNRVGKKHLPQEIHDKQLNSKSKEGVEEEEHNQQ